MTATKSALNFSNKLSSSLLPRRIFRTCLPCVSQPFNQNHLSRLDGLIAESRLRKCRANSGVSEMMEWALSFTPPVRISSRWAVMPAMTTQRATHDMCSNGSAWSCRFLLLSQFHLLCHCGVHMTDAGFSAGQTTKTSRRAAPRPRRHRRFRPAPCDGRPSLRTRRRTTATYVSTGRGQAVYWRDDLTDRPAGARLMGRGRLGGGA